MNTEEFEKATEKDLRRKANECFEKLKDSGSGEWPALLLSARFYLDEIERREHDRVARRDLFLELVVIVLIGLELYFGYTGGNAQLAVLEKLNSSASQTTAALAALADEQKASKMTMERFEKQLNNQPQKNSPDGKRPSAKQTPNRE